MDERLHKLLAQHGLGSRRQVEDWIRDGRVLVNGKPAEIGQRVGARDRVVVDGRDVTKRIASRPSLRVLLYHKPSGEMVRSREGDDRAAIEARLPSLRGGRWLPVNALAFGEDGLLVLSNDGTLAAAIAHRVGPLPVEYRVRVLRPPEERDWPELPTQVELDGEVVEFTSVERVDGTGANFWFKVTADRPPRRGAIRALFDAAGLKVSRVMLVRWGPVALPRDLPRGRSRELAGADLDGLLDLAGRRPERRAKPTARRSGGR